MQPHWQTRGAEKNLALGARFQKLRGNLLSGEAEFSEGQGVAKFSKGTRFSRVTMFFCKCVISVATLLLIIHITMYTLISLIYNHQMLFW